jgi:tRNA pseudouridine38-40 synthase
LDSSSTSEPGRPDAVTWRLTIQYNGSAFHGWQRQPDRSSVQELLEGALTRLFGGESIVCHGSGRTDAGVHALGQVVSFRARTPRIPERVRMGLNTMLPPSVSCTEAAIVPLDFHARFSATGKKYRYVILHRRDRCAFRAGRAWNIRVPVDWDLVDVGLAQLVGRHDFSAFRGAGCSAASPVRTIWRAERVLAGDEVHLEFEGEGFLRYQVRRMVGTLIAVGKGARPPATIAELLQSGDREGTGKTAPPDGLYLVQVYYEDLPWSPIPKVEAGEP